MRLLKEIRNLMDNYHVKSGMYHYYRAEYQQAVDFLRKALRDRDNLTEADDRTARQYLTLALMDWAVKLEAGGEPEAGLEQLRRAAEVSPHYPDIHFRLGGLLERLGRLAGASGEYEAAVDANEEYLDARVALGFCLLKAGEKARATEAFRQAMKIKKRLIERPFRRGLDRLERGDAEGAVEALHQAFLALPRLANEYLKKSLERLAEEDYERALDELDRALELNPEYPDLHNFRGIALCELGRMEEAIGSFRASASLSPKATVPRLNLAFASLRVEQYKEAEAELEAILELHPSEPAARAMMEELHSGRAPEKRRPVAPGNSV
jgi:tetratricopeptide (TPR) repeat protein